jgi:branched-chain amino acid aminotransferase
MHAPEAVKTQSVSRSRLSKVDMKNLEFGQTPTDHMFISWYRNGQWDEGSIESYHRLSLSPFALCFHYGQTVFEGMKAFRMTDGNISIFRADKNQERMNRSLFRMAMPEIPAELFRRGLADLIAKDADWVPDIPGSSLYIRPFVIATEEKLGVRPSDEYCFIIACCPVGAYYSKPLKVKVEKQFIRAAEGGAGYAKCGGNYGGSLHPFRKAKEEGFDQILWTDAAEREFIEESGTMNVMFVIGDNLVTPSLSETILDGVTRDSILQLARDWGMPVEERKISYREVTDNIRRGMRVEAFGAGTAAVVSPIESITADGETFPTYTGADAVMFRFKAELENIRLGKTADIHHWNTVIKPLK